MSQLLVNQIAPYTGNTVEINGLFITNGVLSATTYQNLPTDVYVTGGTYSSGTATFTNNTGGTFSVTGLTTPFTGGTVSGNTVFTNGLTATTISATTISATTFYGDGSNLTGMSSSSSPISVSGTSLYSNNPSTSEFTGTDGIFFGPNAGYLASNAQSSNFFGANAGNQATGSTNSNFFGVNAGLLASNASYSNIFGANAGNRATNATYSNFFGGNAGRLATNASYSNFFGLNTGNQATNASYSNFFGQNAGYQATNASYSNFFGQSAGYQATNATYSSLIGYRAGYSYIGNNIGSNNIIIGTNVTLANATTDGINIGGVLFGTGTYSNNVGNPITGTTDNSKIGIRVPIPTSALDVSGSTGYDQLRMRKSYTPTGSGDTNGNLGDVAWDDTYLYLKTNTGWGRVQLNYGF